ncbi:hypothetical protein I5N59_21695 [Serratia marcescens]|nr:hypothetical protein [Serratia marcescens]
MMKKTRDTEEQIAFALKQTETGPGWKNCSERWAFLKPLFTIGRKSLARLRDRIVQSTEAGG